METKTDKELIENLSEELRIKLGIKINLPKPPTELLEIQRILIDESFHVDPIVYFSKRGVRYALLDSALRPMRDQDFANDGFSPIIERNRQNGNILPSEETEQISPSSRFGLSFNDVQKVVIPKVADITPRLAALLRDTHIELRVPTREHFIFAGMLRYPHFGEANTWEWLSYDESSLHEWWAWRDTEAHCTDRLIGANKLRGGLWAIDSAHAYLKAKYIAFRLETVFPPQSF